MLNPYNYVHQVLYSNLSIPFLSLSPSLSSLMQIIYFTATFPYVVLICFFFRAVTLEGAGEGLRFLFLPSGGREWVSQYNNYQGLVSHR